MKKPRKFYEMRGKFCKLGGNEDLSEIGGNGLKDRKLGGN